ncbi:FGGY-family carbohydrate kinase, partial [Candidatus Poribacteria bacterium]
METIIAYDLGTGGNKASLYSADGVCLESVFVPYPTYYPYTGWHEQKPEDWWHAVVESTKNLLSESTIPKDTIRCLALSGQSLAVVPLDRNGSLLRDKIPIWSDTRASAQTDIFFQKIDGNSWYETTGGGFSKECYSIFKVMWYRDNEPDLYRKISKILGSKDYINFRLTGKMYTDFSYASGSGIYNLLKKRYDTDLLKASAIPGSIFPEIVPSTHSIGKISADAAKILGLSEDVEVMCGGVDNSCMALGAGNTEEGNVYLSLGSSAWIAVSSGKPIINKEIKPFVFAHVIPDMFTSATSIFSAGSTLKWLRDTLCIDLKQEAKQKQIDPYDLMVDKAMESPIGANRLFFNPSLAGGSAAYLTPEIRGAFLGIDLLHSQADIIRAVMEGIAMDLAIMYDKLAGLCDLSDEVLIVGGGGKSKPWRQMFADIWNRKFVKAN